MLILYCTNKNYLSIRNRDEIGVNYFLTRFKSLRSRETVSQIALAIVLLFTYVFWTNIACF